MSKPKMNLINIMNSAHDRTIDMKWYKDFFTAEHYHFRDAFRTFLHTEVVPHIPKWEKEKSIERFIWEEMAELGCFGLRVSEEYGGTDADLFYTLIYLEEMQCIGSGGYAAAMWAHSYLPMTYVRRHGDHDQKVQYLIPSVEGKKIGALCVTEPGAGSDVASIKSTAKKQGEGYLLSIDKTFATNGMNADYFVIAVKTNPELGHKGISLFVVDRDMMKDVSFTAIEKLGWNASDTAGIIGDFWVPEEALLGKENMGFTYIMENFAFERWVMAVNAHARADFAIALTLDYMDERIVFNRPLGKQQVLRHKIVEDRANVKLVKTFNYCMAERMNKGIYMVEENTETKFLSTDLADQVIYNCMQTHGGYGYTKECLLESMIRDSRLGPIGGGASEVMKDALSKIVIDGREYLTMTKDT